jgi:hypothetical protein
MVLTQRSFRNPLFTKGLDALDRSIMPTIEVRAKLAMIKIILLTPLVLMLLSIPHAYMPSLAFLTSLSTDIGAPDIKHQCPNDNSSSSCYSLGLRSGLVAGKEMRV